MENWALLVKKLWRGEGSCGKREEKWGDIREDGFGEARFEVERARMRAVLGAVQ
jgi:hypothetical protein